MNDLILLFRQMLRSCQESSIEVQVLFQLEVVENRGLSKLKEGFSVDSKRDFVQRQSLFESLS